MSFCCPAPPCQLDCVIHSKSTNRPHTMVHSPSLPHLLPSFTTKSLSHVEWAPTSIHTPPPQEWVFSYPGVKRERTTMQFILGRTDWGRGLIQRWEEPPSASQVPRTWSEERSSVGISPYWRGWLYKVFSQGQRPWLPWSKSSVGWPRILGIT